MLGKFMILFFPNLLSYHSKTLPQLNVQINFIFSLIIHVGVGGKLECENFKFLNRFEFFAVKFF